MLKKCYLLLKKCRCLGLTPDLLHQNHGVGVVSGWPFDDRPPRWFWWSAMVQDHWPDYLCRSHNTFSCLSLLEYHLSSVLLVESLVWFLYLCWSTLGQSKPSLKIVVVQVCHDQIKLVILCSYAFLLSSHGIPRYIFSPFTLWIQGFSSWFFGLEQVTSCLWASFPSVLNYTPSSVYLLAVMKVIQVIQVPTEHMALIHHLPAQELSFSIGKFPKLFLSFLSQK